LLTRRGRRENAGFRRGIEERRAQKEVEKSAPIPHIPEAGAEFPEIRRPHPFLPRLGDKNEKKGSDGEESGDYIDHEDARDRKEGKEESCKGRGHDVPYPLQGLV
jgi:hypothetical protein